MLRFLSCAAGLSLAVPATAVAQRFSFEGSAPDHVAVTAATPYDPARGYGWDDASRFSVRLAEGNYRVTVVLGGTRASATTVKAEDRRLMLAEVRTPAGRRATRSFVVNVRTPMLVPPPRNAPGGDAVRMSEAEARSASWDDRLTLEFLGDERHVARVAIVPADVPTIYLAGDSTVADQRAEPAASWGQMLPGMLDDGIAVANHAKSGETLKSFVTGLRLDKILAGMRSGDVLLIQFGHNDQKQQWAQTYADPVRTFPAYLRAYVAEARRRGATPVLVTSPERRNFDAAGKIAPSLGEYPEAVRRVAREDGVALIDLTPMSVAFYEALGPTRAPAAFNDGGKDRTHHNNYGAYLLARMVATRLGAAVPAIASHVAADARSFDPAAPLPPSQFRLPTSILHSAQRPEGN